MRDPRLQRTSIEEGDWILGSASASVTILEYGDFQCPYCAAARLELEAVVAESRQHVRLVFRNFPISSLHPHAADAAEAAEAAGARGLFWQMHDKLYENQHRLDVPHLVGFGEALGIPVAEFQKELDEHVYRPAVREDFRKGLVDGVNGTPTLFLNGVRYDGNRDRSSIFAAIAEVSGIGAEPRL